MCDARFTLLQYHQTFFVRNLRLTQNTGIRAGLARCGSGRFRF